MEAFSELFLERHRTDATAVSVEVVQDLRSSCYLCEAAADGKQQARKQKATIKLTTTWSKASKTRTRLLAAPCLLKVP